MGLWNKTACTLGTACLRQSRGTLLGLPDLVKPLILRAAPLPPTTIDFQGHRRKHLPSIQSFSFHIDNVCI